MDPQTKNFPQQHQDRQPGREAEMNPQPQYESQDYTPSGKLQGKTAIITGGDSGIGRAVSVMYAKEGANVVIAHLHENGDAQDTAGHIRDSGGKCAVVSADLRSEEQVQALVSTALESFGGLDILVNNGAVQYPQNSILDISAQQLQETFESNFYSYFYMTKASLPHLKQGSAIINTASVTAFEGNATLIDYSSTKGAIVAFTRSMALSLVEQGIRVNAVSPGPVWTPLIVSTLSPQKVEQLGANTPMKRAAQPHEMAPAYVYLASQDSSNMTGQVMHINSGTVIA